MFKSFQKYHRIKLYNLKRWFSVLKSNCIATEYSLNGKKIKKILKCILQIYLRIPKIKIWVNVFLKNKSGWSYSVNQGCTLFYPPTIITLKTTLYF